MDLLIYGPAIFAGIIASRYLSRLANFCLMVAVYELNATILLSVLKGELRLRLLIPYTFVCIIPAMAGMVGRRYLGSAANAGLIMAVFYVAVVLLALPYAPGHLWFLPPPGAIFVSPGDLVPPLFFILVAIVAYADSNFKRTVPSCARW